MSDGIIGSFEAVRPWLSTAFIGSILAIVVKLYVDNRRLKLAEKSRAEDFQLEVSADGRTNLQFVIDNLVRDITAQREATATVTTAHAHCQEELQSVRDTLTGLQRQFINFQMTVGRAIPPGDWSPEISRMMDDLAQVFPKGQGGNGQ